ncbi:MAG: hypothetical protein ACR2NR_08775 [Solirubrobacteraceae bacterium]
MRLRLPATRAALLGLVTALFVPALAHGATLVGGHEQSAIAKAFFAGGAHGGQAIVSTRASTVMPSWAVVKSVTPQAGNRTSASSQPVRLQASYYHLRGARVKPGTPPAAVRIDLARDFRIAVVYTGSGSEAIAYKQLYRSVCAGAGGFTDEQDDTVAPMSWSVRYEVDLDSIQSAVRSASGAVLVPSVSFLRSRSTLSARQTLARTTLDEGCNGIPTAYACTTTYALAAPSDGLLSFGAGGGLEIGVPTTAKSVGDCDPSNYTLGPSLWDGGATTALAGPLGLVGAKLPDRPYAPVRVSWPADAAALTQGFVASPCQGDGPACRDSFGFTGQIALQPVAIS